MADGQVVFEITADGRHAIANIQDITRVIREESDRWDRETDDSADHMERSFAGSLKNIAATFAASKIGAFLIDFGKQAISAASDLEEVQNVVDVTFGESSAQIDAWAKTAISQFGLTETQAKRFASTMGAMMKSSGLASGDIVEMSENLSGLAADMASFYNLDFDEAFNKIRSGISGETEPLKQLGINMSVANLEAFALEKGITKAFSKMSQSEQIMLRYQYLMQATADAQGDFARTSDGFANGLRLLDSNFEALKTTIGTLLIPAVSEAIGFLNDMLSLLVPKSKPTTVLDDFAAVDLQTEEKLADIEKTRKDAMALVDILDGLNQITITDQSEAVGNMADGANKLSGTAGSNWTAFISGLDGVDGLITDASGAANAGSELSGLADGAAELTGTPETSFKYSNLPPAIQALYDKATGVDNAKEQLGTLDTEAGKLTEADETSFKYATLTTKIGELVAQAGKVITEDTEGDLGTLKDAADEMTGTGDRFKYSNVISGVGELISQAGRTITEDTPGDLDTLQGAADEMTGAGDQFKYNNVISGVGELITQAGSAVTNNTSSSLSGLAAGASALAGNQENFKYANLTDDTKGISSLVNDATGADSAGDKLKKLGEGAAEVAGETLNFKYSQFGAKAKEIIDGAKGGITAGIQLSGLSENLKKVAGTAESFKYSGFGAAAKEVIDNAAGGVNAGIQINGLSDSLKNVAGTVQNFKYPDFGKAAKEVIDNAAGGIAAGIQLTGLGKGASDLAGNEENFKYPQYGKKAKEVIDNAAGGITAGIQLTGLAGGADKLAGQAKNFAYSALTGATDGVATLISQAQGGTQAGSDLQTLGEGASTVASVNYPATNGSLEAMASDINILDSRSARNWTSILNVFKNVPGYTDKFSTEKIKGIADAFAELDGDKAGAWNTLMDALGSDLTALTSLTGTDEQTAAQWLSDMKEAANGLNPDDVNSWNTLLSLLAAGTPGAGNYLSSEDMEAIAKYAGMQESTVTKLGNSSLSASDKQAEWLETCKRLVALMPELSDIINTETGEIKGGTSALRDRITALSEEAEAEVLMYGIKQKRLALEKKFEQLPSLKVDVVVAKNNLDAMQEEYDAAKKRLEELGGAMTAIHGSGERQKEAKELLEVIRKYEELQRQYEELRDEYQRQMEAYRQTEQGLKDLEEQSGTTGKSLEDGASSAKEFSDEAKKAAKEGVEKLTDALKEMNDYVERTRDSTASNVDSALKNFAKFETGEEYFERLKKEQGETIKDLEKQIADAKKDGKNTWELELKLGDTKDAVPSLQNMRKAYEDQLKFIQEYQANLDLARKNGASDELLAQFADFSQENAGYLYLLAHGSKEEVAALDAEYKKVSEAKKPLIDSLTETKLAADEQFEELVAKAKEAAIQLNNADVAKDSMAATVGGIAEGIAEKVPEVKEAVDALNAELDRLGSTSGLNVFGGLKGGNSFNFHFTPDGSFAVGTDYVPFDNFLAYLHEGEAVLTAEEAAVWRNFKSGGSGMANSIDYGRLSGEIWDKAPSMGGNVYLDGHTVGRVISSQQANSYRALERSGWQG